MTPIEKKHFWQQQIHDCEASGISGSAFCKQQSLIYHQFVYWRQKLAPAEDTPKQTQASTGFARVVSSATRARVGADDVDGLTVSLPGGVAITGLHAGNIELLGAVLRQL
ncbi:IS66 family insertion sequence element accessory protein TnpB [Marinobacter sp. S6332]|uniref:IS66 family insertion sequence element accessory protein TnpA n=1 Tax=Marinobacter sp. S6332 TaxID=2926403 RepID=UPI001FF4B2B8|nr:IS66 family insertion sequence element accessory protein TnpB [Marinobacter sp. S6332]MCK0165788.1 IS66 family insertion sequence element accessory protein TnpB [Marinobacter sp. S6332]